MARHEFMYGVVERIRREMNKRGGTFYAEFGIC